MLSACSLTVIWFYWPFFSWAHWLIAQFWIHIYGFNNNNIIIIIIIIICCEPICFSYNFINSISAVMPILEQILIYKRSFTCANASNQFWFSSRALYVQMPRWGTVTNNQSNYIKIFTFILFYLVSNLVQFQSKKLNLASKGKPIFKYN